MFRRPVIALVFAVLAACSSNPATVRSTTTATSASTSTTTTTVVVATTTTLVVPPVLVQGLNAGQLGASWRPGCPVPPEQLRSLHLEYWGFDGASHSGQLIVHASVVDAATKVFATLYREHFPIRKIEPIDGYGGSDEASLEADNTAGFNCRQAVSSGPPHWSAHAYGKAIDINPVENPYIEGGRIHPANGADYVNRTPYRPGMAVPGGVLVKAFASVGWQWGGRWAGTPDYQHFSSTGG